MLSHSTKNYDRGEKFEMLRMIETFREYLLISQEKCHVAHFVKQSPDQWVMIETNHPDSILSLVIPFWNKSLVLENSQTIHSNRLSELLTTGY